MLATALARYRSLSRNARLYLLSNTIQAVSVGAAAIIYTLFLKQLGHNNTFISEVLFVGALGGAVGILPAGMLVDRLGWRVMLLASDFVGGIALLAQFVAPTPPVILATSLVVGFSVAMVLVVNGPLLTANSSAVERTALFGLSNATSFLASVVGSLLGGFLPDWLSQPGVGQFIARLGLSPLLVPGAQARGYQLALLVSGALAIPSLLPVLMMREERRTGGMAAANGARWLPFGTMWATTRSTWHSQWTRARATMPATWAGARARLAAMLRGPIARFSVTQSLLGVGAGIFAPYINIYFVDTLHASTAYFGALTSGLTILLALAGLCAAPLAERFGKLRLVVVARLCSLPFLLSLGLFPVLAICSIAYLLRGMCMYVADPALGSFYMEAVPARQRGLASSVYNGTWQGAWALGALLGGPISDAGGARWLFFLATPLYAASILLLAFWFLRPGTGRLNTEDTDDVEGTEGTEVGEEIRRGAEGSR
jgi:MFS family permease